MLIFSYCSLHPVPHIRSSEQYSTKEVQTPVGISWHAHYCLGYRNDMHWSGAKLRQSLCSPNPTWRFRVGLIVTSFIGQITSLTIERHRAGFFPGAIYLCSYWYMPKDLATRISYFYCASALSGAFSGLLAAGIAEMDGVGGYEGWRWIFILEGIPTVLIGVACYFLLIDTPALSTRWLEPDEIRYLEISMFIKQGGMFRAENGFRWKDLKMVLSNWRIYMQAYFLFVQSALSYGKRTLIGHSPP